MLTYCYRCDECGRTETRTERRITFCDSDPTETRTCEGFMRRDWKAEAVSFGRVPGGGRD